MIASFVLTYGLNSDETKAMAARLAPYDLANEIMELRPGLFFAYTGFGTNAAPHDACIHPGKEMTFIYVGSICNISDIRKLTIAEKIDPSLDDAGFLYEMYRHHGNSFFPFLQGRFIFLIVEEERIICLKDRMGSMQLYYSASKEAFIITPEIKSLINSRFTPRLANIVDPGNNNISAFFDNIKRLGEETKLEFSGEKNYPLATRDYPDHLNFLSKAHFVSVKEAGDLFMELLISSVENSLDKASEVSIPVSGGVDSGTIAALTARRAKKLFSFSIGTLDSNEFSEASELAEFINSEHSEIILHVDDILDGIMENIYYNEVADPLCLEILSPFASLFRNAGYCSDHMLTGYGADLLMGGTLLQELPDNVNSISRTLIKKAAQSGEYNPFLAMKYGISVHHPYWTAALMSHCLSMPGSFKNYNREVKYFFRDAVYSRKILPSSIAWRPKLGIHVGSSISHIISRLISPVGDVTVNENKSAIYKEIIRLLFSEGVPIFQIDISFYFKRRIAHLPK